MAETAYDRLGAQRSYYATQLADAQALAAKHDAQAAAARVDAAAAQAQLSQIDTSLAALTSAASKAAV